MLKKLVKLANDLDLKGLEKEAESVDKIIEALVSLLNNSNEEEADEEGSEEGEQIEFHGETTENFDLCQGAVKAFSALKEKVGESSKGLALEALKETDKLLGIERDVIDFETATEKDLKKVLDLAQSVAYKAGVLSEMLNDDLSDDFAFLNMHVEKIVEYMGSEKENDA
jgi:hypothetical protein